MTFEEQVRAIDSDIAGIYLITNTVNGKHYVGQSIYLRKRLLHHISNFNCNRYDAPLYRAFNKYGIDCFKVDVLWSTHSKEFNTIKATLDRLEKQYIEEYHSYGEYNQTLGGDAGVLGYKFTEEQRTKAKEIAVKLSHTRYKDKDGWIYAKNLETGETHMAITPYYLSVVINIPASTLHSACRPSYGVCYKKYIVARTPKELDEKLKKYNTEEFLLKSGKCSHLLNNISAKYKSFLDGLNGTYTIDELAKMQGVSRHSILKRNQKLRSMGYEIKCIDSHRKLDHCIVRNIDTNEEWTYTSTKEAAKKTGISVRYMKQLACSGKSKNGYTFEIIFTNNNN